MRPKSKLILKFLPPRIQTLRVILLLLLDSVGHKLLLGALRADDVLAVRDEALPDHAGLAGAAGEAVVVPVPALERNEAGAADTCDRFAAGCAPLGEELPEAVGAVRLVVPRGEPLAGERFLAVGAGETFSVPWLVAVGHPSLGDHLIALDTLGGKFIFVTLGTVDVVLLWYEALGSNRILTGAADKTFLVPLAGLVLHLLHSSSENISTAIASCCKLSIVA